MTVFRLVLALIVAVSLAAPAFAQEAAPDFTLLNQDGGRIRLSQFRGKWVLLTFIYTHCVDTCPLATGKMAIVQDALKKRGAFGTKVVFMSMTFDPKRDTPAIMKKYGQRFKADFRGWHFLSGDPATVTKVVASYRIPVKAVTKKPGFLAHAQPLLVIDPQGRIIGHYEPWFNPQDAIRDLEQLLGS